MIGYEATALLAEMLEKEHGSVLGRPEREQKAWAELVLFVCETHGPMSPGVGELAESLMYGDQYEDD